MVRHPWPLLEISLSDFRSLATLNINTNLFSKSINTENPRISLLGTYLLLDFYMGAYSNGGLFKGTYMLGWGLFKGGLAVGWGYI